MKLQPGQKGAKCGQQRGLGLRLDPELKPGQRQKATCTRAHCGPGVALPCVPGLFLRTICKGDILIPTFQKRKLRLGVVIECSQENTGCECCKEGQVIYPPVRTRNKGKENNQRSRKHIQSCILDILHCACKWRGWG